MNAPPDFANAVANAVQRNTKDFMPLSVRYGAAEAAWAEVERFLALPVPATPEWVGLATGVPASAKPTADNA